MRKIILSMSISLDGFVSGPNGELDWVLFDKDLDNEFLPESTGRADTLILGRSLYQGFSSYWPTAPETNPNLSEGEIQFSHWVQNARKIVFSKTMEKANWNNSQLMKEDFAAEISKLKQQPGKDILTFGGVGTAASLVRWGLVDEYNLAINPVILGSGRPLFSNLEDQVRLKLIKSRAYKSGIVLLTYQPA